MNTHKNARLTVHSRALLVHRIVDNGQRPLEAAQAMGVSAAPLINGLPVTVPTTGRAS